MKIERAKVTLRFKNSVLGSQPGDKKLMTEHISSKAPTTDKATEEIASVSESLEKGTTVFSRNKNGELMMWDYQIRGMFKEQILALIELGDIISISKWGYKKAVDSFLFIKEREIPFLKDDKPIKKEGGFCERPLLAETMQGPRVCLARSEELDPDGLTLSFTVELMRGSNGKSKSASLTMDKIQECLEYGRYRGFGQWRNSGKGRFDFDFEVTE